nr:hypothetical protein [Nocardia terpenica]
MMVTERGATRGDSGRDTGRVHGHHVGVALDDDYSMAGSNLPPGVFDAEQDARFLVQHGLWCVDVFGLQRVVGEQAAGTESEYFTGLVADRPDEASAESVDHPMSAAAGQPCCFQFVGGESGPL